MTNSVDSKRDKPRPPPPPPAPRQEKKQPAPAPNQHVVKSGDTLSGIAKSNGVTLDALRRANPQVGNGSLIRPGQVISIPADSFTPARAPLRATPPPAAPVAAAPASAPASLGDMVESIYASELGRASDPAGKEAWTGFAQSLRDKGQSDQQIRDTVTTMFRQSDEYRARPHAQPAPVSAPPAVAPANGVAPVAPGAVPQRVGPLAPGYHLQPDLIAHDWAQDYGQIRGAIRDVAASGAKSATLIVRTDTPADALKTALDEAAKQGIKLELRVDFANKQGVPIHAGPDGLYKYDSAEGAAWAQAIGDKLAALSPTELAAVGSIQLGNEPLDPKGHTQYLGRDFSSIAPGEDINADYLARVAAAGTTPGAVARSNGLAVRDMMVDIGSKLVARFGDGIKAQLATPAMGAGWAAYNDAGAQKEYFLGVMGKGLDGKWGQSAFAYAAQSGQHAYMDPAAIAQGSYPSSTDGYLAALDAAAKEGHTQPAARPVFSEVGIGYGDPKNLDAFMQHVVAPWNQQHPESTVAAFSIWGTHPNYQHEKLWEAKLDVLAPSVRALAQ